MIKNYNKFNEGINQYLKGPTEEEVIKSFEDDPDDLLISACKSGDFKYAKIALDLGADPYSGNPTPIMIARDNSQSDVIGYINYLVQYRKVPTPSSVKRQISSGRINQDWLKIYNSINMDSVDRR